MAFITDSKRPQPLRQPPPTADLTASGAASEVPSLSMRPWFERMRHPVTPLLVPKWGINGCFGGSY